MIVLTKPNNSIHLVHFSSRPGGIEVIIPEIIRSLPEFLFSSFVLRPNIANAPNIYGNLNIKVTYGFKSNLLVFYKLFVYAIRYKSEIFHVFNIGPFYLFVLRLAGIKRLIYSIHGTIYWQNKAQKILRKIFWNAAICNNYIITSNSVFSAQVFRKVIYDKDHIQLLYNPIESNRFTPPLEDKRADIPENIIYCGRLAKGKNLEKWIGLAEFIKRHFPKVVFSIYGYGPDKERLQEIISKRRLDSFIFMKGFSNNPERLYQSADLLIFLSNYESFGNVVVESILCGTPVIASAIPSMKEIFVDFPDFLVELNENLEENVLEKLKNFRKLKSDTKEARESFIKRFSAEVHYMKLRDLYGSFR